MAQATQLVNPNADVLKSGQASLMNINAARGLQDVLSSNLGPRGTLKMLVGGSGDIKLTKDGNTLLHEMQIQNPTACMIARIATAQDDITGDGTTSVVLIVGEIMKQAERHISDGVHPRLLCDGIELAKTRVLEYIDEVRVEKDTRDRALLLQIAEASLRTKMHAELADLFTDIVVDAVLTVRKEGEPMDLHMVEIMHMQHRAGTDSRLVKGLVMDHGGRHPGMPKSLKKVRILTINYDLEYMRSEVASGFYYSSAEERIKMVEAERKWVDDRTQKIIELKRAACAEGETMIVCNQKGIDPLALDMLAAEGILALRRVKRRNMERLVLACGGEQVNEIFDMSPAVLGYAEEVHEESLGDETYTFVEGVANPFSCTILIKGAHPHIIAQIKEATRDGLRAVFNAIQDKHLLPGAGAVEVMCHSALMKYKETVTGRAKLGVQAYADGLLVIPKTLAENSGYDAQDSMIKLQEAHAAGKSTTGFDIDSGEPVDPRTAGIWDNYRVVRQMLDSSAIISAQLLLVDEVIRAGKQMKKG